MASLREARSPVPAPPAEAQQTPAGRVVRRRVQLLRDQEEQSSKEDEAVIQGSAFSWTVFPLTRLFFVRTFRV